jgi:LuxR family transcriptional regulator, maltose regulon positive regulatory protein
MNPCSALPDLSPLAQALKCLGAEADVRLALLVAPPGSGKTKALRRWVQTHPDISIGWLGLGEDDNSAAVFFEALRAAFHSINPQSTSLIPPQNGKTEPFDLEEGTIDLINALTTVPNDYFLILDNYQAIISEQIHAAVSLLLDYQPPKMHLVIASRSEPPLPIPRLRVRRQLIELGPEDLKRIYE